MPQRRLKCQGQPPSPGLGLCAGFSLLAACILPGDAQPAQGALEFQTRPAGIWQGEIGGGFRKDAVQAGFALGAGFGNRAFGSLTTHDLALATVHAGWVMSGVVAPEHWCRGNWELIGELFAGAQIHPGYRYVAGFTPLLRYNFATGTRWVPFANLGVGVAGTDIEGVDLSGKFQFCPSAGLGTHYFLRENLALTLQYRALHLSNAGIRTPNHGVNAQMFSFGLTWFY